MKTLDDMIGVMYSSKDFSIKGRAKDLKDAFLMRSGCRPYVVFLTKNSRLDGSDLRFDYAFFSVDDRRPVEGSSDEYLRLVADLPTLSGLSYAGGTVDFARTMQLEDLLREIVERFLENGSLTAPEAERYQTYLSDMRQLKSPTFRILYDYFSKRFGR